MVHTCAHRIELVQFSAQVGLCRQLGASPIYASGLRDQRRGVAGCWERIAIRPHEVLRVSTQRRTTMHDDKPLPSDLPTVHRRKLTVDFEGGSQSSGGGRVFGAGGADGALGAARMACRPLLSCTDVAGIRPGLRHVSGHRSCAGSTEVLAGM